MIEHDVSRVPVLRDGPPVGTTRADIVRTFAPIARALIPSAPAAALEHAEHAPVDR
jgi:hypothetical protein